MYTEQERYERAKKRVRKKKAFYSNLFSWIVTCSFLFFINLRSSPHHLWAVYPFLGWGLGVAFEAWELYGPNGLLANEEDEIEREMAWMSTRSEQRSFHSAIPSKPVYWEQEEEAHLELPVIPKMWNDRDFV